MSFRQVKFIVKRGERSPVFNLELKNRINDYVEELLVEKEDDENVLDTLPPTIDILGGNPNEFHIIASNVDKDFNLQEIKQKLNEEYENSNITFDYEVIGGKRRSSKRRSSGGKRRSSKRKIVRRKRRSSQRRRF